MAKADKNEKSGIQFTQSLSGREAPCVGVYGPEGSGKSRFCVTAGAWAERKGKIPGWLVLDRKTRNTVRIVCQELGLPIPLINDKDFITRDEALKIAQLDRVKDDAEVKSIYTAVYQRILEATVALGEREEVEPIVIDTGTQVWDYISFAHFGRQQDLNDKRAGMVWGPPKQDWTDMVDGLAHKTTILTFWQKDEYRNNARTGFTIPDGPKHLGHTVTTLVRLSNDRKVKGAEAGEDREKFLLDVYLSQDNCGLEGAMGVLQGDGITYENLLGLLRPEMMD